MNSIDNQKLESSNNYTDTASIQIGLSEKEQLESLLDISSGLYLAKSFEDIGRCIVDVLYKFKLGDVLGTKLGIYDFREDTYTIVYQTDFENKEIYAKVGFPSHSPIQFKDIKYYSKFALEQRKTLIIQDNHSEFSLGIAQVQKDVIEHSMIFIPLIYDDKIVGLLSFARSPKNSMIPELVNFLENIGMLISVVISKMLNEKRRDIIEKKILENERMYRILVDSSPDAVSLIDINYSILFCNQQTAKIHLYESSDELIGKSILEFINPDEHERFIDDSMECLQKNISKSRELKLKRKDGSVFIAALSIQLIFDSFGKPKAYMWIMRDLTNQKNIEAQVLRSQRMESISTLADRIANKLNNFFGPILISIELLRKKHTTGEDQLLFKTIEKSATRGDNFTKQLLTFAKGHLGKKTEVQITNIIDDVIKMISETFPKNIKIRKKILNPLWTISADPMQIRQVLLNLSGNAYDAMKNGGDLLITADNIFIDEIYTKHTIEAKVGSYVKIEVQDSGKGIPIEIQDNIFEPFFSTKDEEKGFGLGLSTVYSIVKNLGGFINFYSEINIGSSFKIYLPSLYQDNLSEKPELDTEIFEGNGELILVVDDSKIYLDVAQTILESNGYEVITADNGNEAVTFYSKNIDIVKVVLIDQIMPIMDGPSTAKALRRLNPDVKIIAMSGFTIEDMITPEDLVQGILQKPFHAEKLLKTIHDVLK
jgi:two-component system, cell cycle sensor histidine kinase and response regulator CckA